MEYKYPKLLTKLSDKRRPNYAREPINPFRHREIYTEGDTILNINFHIGLGDTWAPFGRSELPITDLGLPETVTPNAFVTKSGIINLQQFINLVPNGVYFIFACRASQIITHSLRHIESTNNAACVPMDETNEQII